jgi:hypothetical protein
MSSQSLLNDRIISNDEIELLAQESGLLFGFPLCEPEDLGDMVISSQMREEILNKMPIFLKSLVKGTEFETECLESLTRLENELESVRQNVRGDLTTSSCVDIVIGPKKPCLNRWFTGRPWKGQYGYVETCLDKETSKYRKLFHGCVPWQDRFRIMMDTIAHRNSKTSLSAERKAHELLLSKLSPRQQDIYFLNQVIFENGKSGLTYIIRKNRPTLAMRREAGGYRIISALCLHPYGWFKNSWAGVLAPSDEMIFHLLYIRSDEHWYWKKSNQLSPNYAVSGI